MMRFFVLAVLCLASVAAYDTVTWGDTIVTGLKPEEQTDRPKSVTQLKTACVKHAVIGVRNAIYVLCDGTTYITGENINAQGHYVPGDDGVIMGELRLIDGLQKDIVMMAAVGDHHFLVITEEGRVWGWGSNSAGQLALADPETPYATAPQEIKAFRQKNVRLIYAGGDMSSTVTDYGQMWLWGAGVGEGGMLGYGGNAYKPRLVVGVPMICQAAMGERHIAAVARNGNLYVWGDGEAGQLGLGDFKIKKKSPTVLPRLRRNVCYVQAGKDYTSVISQDERVWMWGSDGYPFPFEKRYFQGKKPRQIGAGRAHIVVLTATGTIDTWGSSRFNQAGRPVPEGFTLDVGPLDYDFSVLFQQMAVGPDVSIALSSNVTSPSLCSCNDGWFQAWLDKFRWKTTCTDLQTDCGDGSCCGGHETCCRQIEEDNYLTNYRAIEEKVPDQKPSFSCVKGADMLCCGVGTGMACPAHFRCNLDVKPPRCEPKNGRQMSGDQLEMQSVPVKKMIGPADPSGKVPGKGVCGDRKETCPDESCCPKSFTCCPRKDGYGCCQVPDGQCCGGGCCAVGFTCEDKSCVQKIGTAIVRVPSNKVDGQCGAKKDRCPDSTCCKKGMPCCVLKDGFFGCCPFQGGVCCPDGAGCCPPNHECDPETNGCVRTREDGTTDTVPMKGTPRNTPKRSHELEIKCKDDSVCPAPGSCCV